MHFEVLREFFQTHWGWAAGLAASVTGGMVLVLNLLNPKRKEDIAIWLLGAPSDKDWSDRFCALFDAIFGDRHFTLRCFSRSAVASLLSVVVIWALMGSAETLDLRAKETLTLENALLIALAVNVLVDYLSILQTRFLLGQLHRLQSGVLQFAVLLIDLVLSGALIWVALWLLMRSPLYAGGLASFGETLGMFSPLSVFFFSTFFTSFWSWVFVLSTWILRLIRRLDLGYWLDVERKPIAILSAITGAVVFIGALSAAVPLRKGADGLSPVDHALCLAFEGRVCTRIAALTTDEQLQMNLMFRACTTGAANDCALEALQPWIDQNQEAEDVDLGLSNRQLKLIEFACEGGEAWACQMVVWLNPQLLERLDENPQEEGPALARRMARLMQGACDGGDLVGCSEVALYYLPLAAAEAACERGNTAECVVVFQRELLGDAAPPENLETALDLLRKSCDGGVATACMSMGRLFLTDVYLPVDLEAVMANFNSACDLGYAAGCTLLARVLRELALRAEVTGPGASDDTLAHLALQLLYLGCFGNDPEACNELADYYVNAEFVPQDLSFANTLYAFACTEREARACMNQANLLLDQISSEIPVDDDLADGAVFACAQRYWVGCGKLAWLNEDWQQLRAPLVKATKLAQEGCALGLQESCALAQALGPAHPPYRLEGAISFSLPLLRQGIDAP